MTGRHRGFKSIYWHACALLKSEPTLGTWGGGVVTFEVNNGGGSRIISKKTNYIEERRHSFTESIHALNAVKRTSHQVFNDAVNNGVC